MMPAEFQRPLFAMPLEPTPPDPAYLTREELAALAHDSPYPPGHPCAGLPAHTHTTKRATDRCQRLLRRAAHPAGHRAAARLPTQVEVV